MTRFITLRNTSGVGQPIHIAVDSIKLIESYGDNGGSSINGHIRVLESPEAILDMVEEGLS